MYKATTWTRVDKSLAQSTLAFIFVLFHFYPKFLVNFATFLL